MSHSEVFAVSRKHAIGVFPFKFFISFDVFRLNYYRRGGNKDHHKEHRYCLMSAFCLLAIFN